MIPAAAPRVFRRVYLLLLALLLVIGSCNFSSAAQTTGARSPADFASLSAQAEQARQQDRLEEAVALYRKALALKPSWSEGWWALGTIQYDRSAYQQATAAFQRAVALEPKKGDPRVMLGLCQFELSQNDAALKNILRGKQLGTNADPQFQNVMLYHEGVLYLRKGRFDSAGETFSQLSRQGVQSDDLTLGLGMAVLRMFPKDLPPETAPGRDVVRRAGQAEWLAARKKFDQARNAYAALLRDFPEFPKIYYAYGHFLLETNDADGAVAAFQQEITNSPQSVLARLQIAAVRYRVDSTAGLPYAEEAVKLAPQLPFAHYLYGLLLLDTGDASRAIPELEIAGKGLHNEPGVYLALGAAYAKVGRKQDATRARAVFARMKQQSDSKQSSSTYGEQPALPSVDRATENSAAHPPK